MPIFEYSCRRCHHTFEQLVLSTREKVSCPKCDSSAVGKQLSVFSSPGSEPEATAGGGCACTPQTCGCH
ncbi:MAG TPA: zinc ribbon domain-containing protein [Methylomirabilota bacterium]|nr:zinc ribbon domain-containing protein [Methylomirabilota bacterium]